ncbi:NIPSNAP family protein [Chelativorans sp. AA-79]|uniref:NIPSNAP family protein n=1 Tax=Chelativorans sp. AA-79 TaxID=3028735 RepID=UPI0023F930C3|nr:NIPSNAP family protein [Chelativorans sp. AA-79]WEX07864.1 NIPSNAP family protein [Chelativorans sp. AA-79]
MTADIQVRSGRTGTPTHQNVVELRRYLLHPGQREDLIAIFDRHLVESQEACGMAVLGQFRDLDRPDDFVWLRGFAGMESRRAALTAFYGGPVWAEHRNAANATMNRFDDVLLLRPAADGAAFALDGRERSAWGAPDKTAAVFTVSVFPLAPHRADAFPAYFASTLLPVLMDAGAAEGTCLVTEESENTFPRLPVRGKERVFVWIARFEDEAAQRAFSAHLHASRGWQEAMADGFGGHANAPLTISRLSPTGRSLLR